MIETLDLSGVFYAMKYKSYIKWILLVIGAIRFKTGGAFLGFFIGIFIEELLDNGLGVLIGKEGKRKDNNIVFTEYQDKLIILIAKVLKSDGYISKQQNYYILKYFYRQFGTKNGKALFSKLNEYIPLNKDAYLAARELRNSTNHYGKRQIINFLFGLTKVDYSMTLGERRVLENIAKNLGMSKENFDRIVNQSSKKKTFHNTHVSYKPKKSLYKTLGLTENASENELKRAYRKLVLKYHPDKTKLKASIAVEKFQEVQEAYDKIKEMKGIK